MGTKLDANKLVIGLKKDLKKENNSLENNSVESVVRKLHNAADEKENISERKSTKRITLDIEKPLHKKIALHLVDKDVSFKRYFLDLAKKDLGIQ